VADISYVGGRNRVSEHRIRDSLPIPAVPTQPIIASHSSFELAQAATKAAVLGDQGRLRDSEVVVSIDLVLTK
jgi:hypothetical protein